MRRFAIAALAILLVAGAGFFWIVTEPKRVPPAAVPTAGDPERGRLVFAAGGCASCHTQPGQDDELLLGGGLPLKTPFGTFNVPNISSSPGAGIGGWSDEEFATAMLRGISPDGQHLYPSFPYGAYQNMTGDDLGDLLAFLRTLPPSDNRVADHELSFPYSVRRGLGLWKALYLDRQRHEPDLRKSPEWNRGAYLVNALAHCGECHTPRDRFGGLDRGRAFAGGPSPTGGGRMPNITPSDDGIGDWTQDDIAFSLADGTTPMGDVFGGEMAHVVENMAQLPQSDRQAIAVYLKDLAPIND